MARYFITNVIIKYLYKIIKYFEDLPYEGYASKRSKNMPTESYFYPTRNLEKYMMIFNMCVGPVRTQMTNTQNMNNSEMSIQRIPN